MCNDLSPPPNIGLLINIVRLLYTIKTLWGIIAIATLKCYFRLFIGNFLVVSMSDFYWFGLLVDVAPYLDSWDVYFLLQGL